MNFRNKTGAHARKLRIVYNSPVTLTFFFLCLFVLILDKVTGGRTTEVFFCVYRSSLKDIFTYFRLFGHILGHNGFSHFFNNMCYILLLGPLVEERYGSKTLLVSIVVTAFVSGVLHSLFFPGVGLLGASGIVFMLILLSAFTDAESGEIPLTLIFIAVIYLGQELYDCFFVADNVSHLGHLIGGGCGIGYGVLLKRTPRKK